MRKTVVKVERAVVDEAMKLKKELAEKDDKFAVMDKGSFISYLLKVGIEAIKKRKNKGEFKGYPLPPLQ